MKNFIKILIFSLFALTSYAQQATEIDSKSVKLPRYADLAAIQAAIPTAQQGMLVYNIGTASNWYYNGSAWTNNNSTPYPLIVTGTTIGTTGNTSITGESIVTYPPIYSGPDVQGGTGVYGISDGGIYGIGVQGQGNGPFHVGVLGLSNYRGVQGGSTSGIGVYGISSNGISGKFEIDSYTNSSDALHAITNGTGKAGLFEINNSGNADNALEGITNGAGNGVRGMSLGGVAGLFTSSNFFTTGGNSALIGHSDKAGFKSIYGISEGNNGQAGVFQIQNSSNSNAALESSTNGTGKAAYFHGTNALETDGTIKFGGSGVGVIANGKVLTSDALGNATWQSIPAVAAPLSLTQSTSTPFLNTFEASSTGTNGGAGHFSITNASNSENALYATTSGTGNAFYATTSSTGTAIRAATNTGKAGYFEISSTANSNDVLSATTTGNGIAINASTSGNGNAIRGTTSSSGKAAYFQGTNALETNGAIKFGGSGVGTIAAGKVLTATDGLGNATWQAIPAVTAPLNLTSTVTTLQSIATGASGFAGDFQITNTSNAANALSSTTTGTGKAAYFQGTNALETNGTIKFGGSGVGTPATGKVLTATDALGNATWQSIPAVAAPLSLSSTATTLTSTSTIGTAANFSSTSGYALVTGSGNVGIGTNTPTAKLEVSGYSKLGDDATAPKIKMKELAVFNSAATYNGQSPQAHGLTASKIISVSVLLEWTTGYFVPVEYSSDVNLRYNFFISPTEIIVQNNTPGPTCPYICGKPVKVLITYKE